MQFQVRSSPPLEGLFYVLYCSNCLQERLTNQNPLSVHIFIGLMGPKKECFCPAHKRSKFQSKRWSCSPIYHFQKENKPFWNGKSEEQLLRNTQQFEQWKFVTAPRRNYASRYFQSKENMLLQIDHKSSLAPGSLCWKCLSTSGNPPHKKITGQVWLTIFTEMLFWFTNYPYSQQF